MKILVTGGAGFIGSNFISYWLNKYKSDRIINLDKLTYAGNLASTDHFSKIKNYRFVKGDICNSNIVDNLMKRVDSVVHFAAESHVDRSIGGSKIFVKTNIVGTHTLLEAALKNKIKRFHHISTDEVFGSLSLSSKNKFNEHASHDPQNPYSASKAASDFLVRSYFHTHGLPITITNCSNNFGPFQSPEKFLPRMITNLIDDKPLPIYGDGKYVRDWLYVKDHVSAIEKVIKKGKLGEIYLVGGMTKDVNNLKIARTLLKIFKKDKSYLKFIKDRPGHDRRYAVDWGKIKHELGWKPKYDFETYLGKTVEWYQKNEWWWRPLKNKAERLYKKTGQR